MNSGVSTYTLLQAYSDFPAFYANRQWQIPESENALPDLLDEVLWNLAWLRAMQDPIDGGVYHKLTNLKFDGAVMPAEEMQCRIIERLQAQRHPIDPGGGQRSIVRRFD